MANIIIIYYEMVLLLQTIERKKPKNLEAKL